MLFIDYSSAFNTIVPSKLNNKLRTLGLNTTFCNWILDFLTGHPQVVRVVNNTFATLILNTGAPQGCVLSALLFTHDCTARHDSNTIIKFADDTTVVGLITDNDKTAYREEVRDLAVWRQDNNLSLNVIKTKEMIVDYRKKRTEHAPILIDGAAWSRLRASSSLVSTSPTNNMVQAHQYSLEEGTTNLFPLRRLKRFGMGPQILKRFYSCTIESVTAWYGNCSASDRKALQRVVRMALYITGANHPGPLYLAVSEEGPKYCQRLQPP
ncbi:unnamed protein product [Oncorhynchus mykiss]|uniref:Reverse transcriptase domain-containing protein n=1 Tax=Oncorhynchus mykiss TaxID=8022 RepID=A0A060WWH3_ONCMY|nr:unnamed protein product [Oncorhynchus mykiss]